MASSERKITPVAVRRERAILWRWRAEAEDGLRPVRGRRLRDASVANIIERTFSRSVLQRPTESESKEVG